MRIGISSTGKTLEDNVDLRFGRCPYFLIVDIEDKEIKNVHAKENSATGQAGGAGIAAAQTVAEEKVEAVITANVGPRAFDVFNQLGIKVYKGEGTVKDAVEKFMRGELNEISNATGPQHEGMQRFQQRR